MACQQAGKNYEGTGRQNRQYNNNNEEKIFYSNQLRMLKVFF